MKKLFYTLGAVMAFGIASAQVNQPLSRQSGMGSASTTKQDAATSKLVVASAKKQAYTKSVGNTATAPAPTEGKKTSTANHINTKQKESAKGMGTASATKSRQ